MCELVRIKINMAVSYQLLGKSKWIAHIRTMPRPDSNRGHSDLQPDALPTELLGLVGGPDAIRTHEFRHCPMVTSIQIEPQTGWRRLAGLCPSGKAMMMRTSTVGSVTSHEGGALSLRAGDDDGRSAKSNCARPPHPKGMEYASSRALRLDGIQKQSHHRFI